MDIQNSIPDEVLHSRFDLWREFDQLRRAYSEMTSGMSEERYGYSSLKIFNKRFKRLNRLLFPVCFNKDVDNYSSAMSDPTPPANVVP